MNQSNFRYKQKGWTCWKYTNNQAEFIEQIEKRTYDIEILVQVWNRVTQKWINY